MRVSSRPSRLPVVLGRVAVAGVAVLASATVGPAAQADEGDLAPPSDETPSAPGAPASDQPTDGGEQAPSDAPDGPTTPDQTAPDDATPDDTAPADTVPADKGADDAGSGTDSAGEAAAAAVAPDFGEQKYLVGVQVKDGSYVEDGATTDGSTFTIRTTLDGKTTTTTCTARRIVDTLSVCDNAVAPAGATVEVVQDTAGPGLTKSGEVRRLEPCTLEPGDEGQCGGGPVFFENTGPLPDPVDDEATTDEDTSVRVDVLANDTSNDPATTISLEGDAEHGDVELVGEPVAPTTEQTGGVGTLAVPAGGTQAVVYTPEAGFTGTDTFTYRLTNTNGSRTATVTVDVVGEAVPPSPGAEEDPSTPSAPLPDTGGADVRLLGLGGALVAAGALLARGRRRQDVA
jgi:LPXTG-motif cell wall-anchored protein